MTVWRRQAPGPEDPEVGAGAGIDATVPHSARIWNCWLGGKDNYAAVPYKLRRADQIERFFDGLEFVTPGLVRCPRWRPEAGQAGGAPDVPTLAGVACKS
jgi:hypothetical protein